MGDAPLLPAKPTYPRSHAAASIAIYLTIVSIVPLLNKRIMRGQTGAAPFPCPLTLTALTSCAVSAMLLTLSTAKHLCWDGGAASGRSWVFGPHLGYKLRAVAPVGLLWGFKGGVSNWGLALLDVPTHNLLMATDLVWSCAFARCINHERPHGLGLGAVAGVTSGAVLVALGVRHQQPPTAPASFSCRRTRAHFHPTPARRRPPAACTRPSWALLSSSTCSPQSSAASPSL